MALETALKQALSFSMSMRAPAQNLPANSRRVPMPHCSQAKSEAQRVCWSASNKSTACRISLARSAVLWPSVWRRDNNLMDDVALQGWDCLRNTGLAEQDRSNGVTDQEIGDAQPIRTCAAQGRHPCVLVNIVVTASVRSKKVYPIAGAADKAHEATAPDRCGTGRKSDRPIATGRRSAAGDV